MQTNASNSNLTLQSTLSTSRFTFVTPFFNTEKKNWLSLSSTYLLTCFSIEYIETSFRISNSYDHKKQIY